MDGVLFTSPGEDGMNRSVSGQVIADPMRFGILGFPIWNGFCPPMLRRSPLAPGLKAKGDRLFAR